MLFNYVHIITPITSAITIAKTKLKPLRTKVNLVPNSFFSSGNVTSPTMVRVVKKATEGTVPTPASTKVPIKGKAINAGTRVIVPSKAEPTVARKRDCLLTKLAISVGVKMLGLDLLLK